ncbi:dTDP-4-dehydrorhamnose 3,5-epimerase-like enzyme [Chryseobacterium defluvii]|uniref:dTDP-4-dehydrorhamnose 3,5-epimerase-like enzyme n=1 Tax=Chryseobacterium defluvii TaxID=160396 RepID=A0A840K9Z8_9FLAO|nr:WxcM-like domain-containing protein [Chryseobacterium defluvii]MBB4806179.1 dTDP-4-dehydrorhamnose 3,5-epimerase-like enzyme [Chryseobacterium defluvii]
MKEPKLIPGKLFSDSRGKVIFNNDFDASEAKRIYFIENIDTDFIRGWQGHKIEQRWYMATEGAFNINLIEIDNWEKPGQDCKRLNFEINAQNFDVLHIPPGYISSIQAIEDNSKLMVMSDYRLHEIDDEYKFPIDYFVI